MQKLKLSRWLPVAVLAVFAAITLFSSAPAMAVLLPPGDSSAGEPTIADQAFSYQAYVYMARDSGYTCANRFANDISPSDIGGGKWFVGGDTTRSGTLLSPDGQADCNNGGGWIDRAVQLWGYGSKTTFLCAIGYVQSVDPSVGLAPGCSAYNGGSHDGGLHNSGVSATRIQQAIKSKAYGNTTPTVTDAMKYYIYFENFVVGCGATKDKPWSEVGSDEQLGDNVYKINFVNPDGTITPTKFTATKGHGDNVTIGYGVDGSGYELSCGELANRLQDNRLATAYAQAVKDNPMNATILANVASGANGTDASEADACGLPPGAMRWIACPVTTALKEFTDFLSDQIMNLLIVPTDQLFSDKFKEVWMTFRNVGMVLVIIAALIMIVSQALGFEFIDAYTIRKVLPRIALVLIGIALAWPLLQFIVTFFNDLGIWARTLIETPFNSMAAENAKEFNNPGMFLNWMVLGIGLPAAVIGAFLLGTAGVLSLMFTFTLALLIGLFVIAMRQLVIAMAIIFAPLALASYILPGTQKLWNFWKQTFITALMMFPIIMAFIAGGKVLSIVAKASNQQFLALLVYFAPYFLLPFAFKLAGGLMSTIFSIANDRGRGLFDRGKKFRQNRTAERGQQWKAGSLREKGADGLGVNALGRRVNAGWHGRYGFGQQGRSMLALDQAVQSNQAMKANPRLAQLALSDDNGNAVLALSGGTEAGARTAARQLFTDDNGVYDEATANTALAAARTVGYTRANAAAALSGLAQNKSRAVGQGRTDIIRDGITRLAGDNAAMNDDLVGTFAFLSRQSGRADLGGMNWGLSGSRQNFNNQVTDLASRYAGGGPVTAAHTRQAMADLSMADGINRTKTSDIIGGHTAGMQQASDSVLRLLEHGNPVEQQLAATALLEFQQNITGASRDNQRIINATLHRAGISYEGGQGTVAQQLANRVGMDANDLTRGARVFGDEIPVAARTGGPAETGPPAGGSEDT